MWMKYHAILFHSAVHTFWQVHLQNCGIRFTLRMLGTPVQLAAGDPVLLLYVKVLAKLKESSKSHDSKAGEPQLASKWLREV